MDDIVRSNPDEEMTMDINALSENADNIVTDETAVPDMTAEAGEAVPDMTVEAEEAASDMPGGTGTETLYSADEPSAESQDTSCPVEDSSSYDGGRDRVYGESADDVYDDPYYDDADYGDDYYDDEYYDDEYYDDEYYDDEYPEEEEGQTDAPFSAYTVQEAGDTAAEVNAGESAETPSYYRGPVSHTYDPNGTEDEKPVYGSYYGNAGTDTGDMGAGNSSAPESGDQTSAGPDRRGPYTSKYDEYRFTAPAGSSKNTGAGNTKKHDVKKKDSDGKKGGFLKRILSAAAYAVVFGGIAAGVFLGVLKMTGFTVPQKEEATQTMQAVPTQIPVLGSQDSHVTAGKADTESDSVELTVPEVVEMCMPSMVAITNTSVEQYYDFFGGAGSRENVSAGSGIIVGETDTELLVATNNHVVANSSEITVTFIDEEAVSGTVKGTDADNDLAVVAVKLDDIKDETKDAIRIVTIGDSESLQVGESVVAIGNALGYGQSVSRGVISALNREVNVDGMSHELIQTDASINPGNSGGALLNMRGELIGINEIKYVNTDVEGVGYAIPTATAKPILESLGSKAARSIVEDDKASYIGIMCIDVPSYYVQSGYPSGVYVSEVTKGGPADKAGLKEGDIITAMDGVSVSTTTQLITYLKYYAAGEEIEFSVSRLNEDETAFEKIKLNITLGNRKDSGIDDSTGGDSGNAPDEIAPDGGNAENGGFDVIPDEKR